MTTPEPTSDSNTYARLSVNLNPRASEALDEAAELTRETKTNVINRALLVYRYLHGVQDKGGVVYVREREGELERLRLL